MTVYKIFHKPTGKYLQEMLDSYNLQRYSGYAKTYFRLGKRGKDWKTKKGVLDAFQNTLKENCKSVDYDFEDFEIHELTLQVTKKFTK